MSVIYFCPYCQSVLNVTTTLNMDNRTNNTCTVQMTQLNYPLKTPNPLALHIVTVSGVDLGVDHQITKLISK